MISIPVRLIVVDIALMYISHYVVPYLTELLSSLSVPDYVLRVWNLLELFGG